MDTAVENTFSTYHSSFKEIESKVLDSEAEQKVQTKLCKLSQDKFKTFLGSPKDKGKDPPK